MAEWSDMEYEMGLIDDRGNILIDNDYYDYMEKLQEEDNEKIEFIEVSLTPSKYLTTSEEKYMRAKLINNDIDMSNILLEVMHDKYNTSDPLAISVYCNKVMIGYIRKYDNSRVDDFCFIDNSLRQLIIKWEKDKFLIYHK